METIELVVCDLAGTSVDDTGGAVLRCLADAAREHDLPGSEHELNALMGMSKLEVFRGLASQRFPNDSERVRLVAQGALATFLDCMRAHYETELRPIQGAEDAFRYLHARDVKVAVDTGFERTIMSLILDRLGWLDGLVDFAVCASDVPRGRPAPYMVFRAMEQLDVIDVRRVMKIGDAPADLEEGTNAGCGEVIGVLSGAHNAETLAAYPHTRLIESVAELPSLFPQL